MNRRSAWLIGLAAAAWVSSSAGLSAQERVRDTKFKYRRGFYSAPFVQVIRTRTPGAKIRYTLDGSAPSATRGLGDSNPVAVPVETTTTLRAIAYKEGMEPTNVDTQTYIFLRDVLRQPAEIDGYPRPTIWEGSGYMT
ncbi:MAG TPA: chitobiase/beta-hexosaminidase C-terminal domain-containing protein, partial [Vicinamibacteria bacterium]